MNKKLKFEKIKKNNEENRKNYLKRRNHSEYTENNLNNKKINATKEEWKCLIKNDEIKNIILRIKEKKETKNNLKNNLKNNSNNNNIKNKVSNIIANEILKRNKLKVNNNKISEIVTNELNCYNFSNCFKNDKKFTLAKTNKNKINTNYTQNLPYIYENSSI